MYSFKSVAMGLRNPSLIGSEISKQVRKRMPHDIGVQGSYETGNIGDRALGEIFKQELQRGGHRVKLHRRNTKSSNAPNRILGGGGVLHDWYGHEHLRRRLNYVTSGERGCILGVGAPGFKSPKAQQLVSETLPELDLITVRDQHSKESIQKVCPNADVSVTACPAFLYADPAVETTGKTGVNFRPYFDEKEDMSDTVFRDYFGYSDLEGATSAYIQNAQRICEELDDPVFIPFHPDDEEFARRHLNIPILDYKFSVDKTMKRVSRMDRMVTTRYHSLIFAAICGKNVLPIAYEPKVEAVADRLNVPWYKPQKEIPMEFSQVENVSSLRSSARKNFELLDGLLPRQ